LFALGSAALAGGEDADCSGESCQAVFRGFFSFLDRRLHGLPGNGRACADCHMPTDNFQLSPADAEARFQFLQARRQRNKYADDPLFRALDADDFRSHGAQASDFSNLRENGLVRITFTLPSNVRLIDPATNAISDETTVDVWRAVPSVMNVKLTGPDGLNPWFRGPNVSGGFQLDGRIGTLQEQAAAALRNHAEIVATPSSTLLDDLTAFQNVCFRRPVCARSRMRFGRERPCFRTRTRLSMHCSSKARRFSRAPAVSVMAGRASRPPRRPRCVITISRASARDPWTPCRPHVSSSSPVPRGSCATSAPT
jgi:hypothetical protein